MHDRYPANVFINCPFDDEYFTLLRPLIFTIVYFGFNPRIALESSDSGKARIEKILTLIRESKFSVHDLSRLRAKKTEDYYRLNMPFELGIDFGLRSFVSAHSEKKALILETDEFEYMKAISDINGYDIKSHDDDIEKLIQCLRSWFAENAGLRNLNSSSKIYADFIVFTRDLFDKKTLKYKGEYNSTRAEKFANDEIAEMTIPEYIDEVNSWRIRHQ